MNFHAKKSGVGFLIRIKAKVFMYRLFIQAKNLEVPLVITFFIYEKEILKKFHFRLRKKTQ